jgi:hypothetical protein
MEVADFVSEFFCKPAALWHMIYDNETVGEVCGGFAWWVRVVVFSVSVFVSVVIVG